MGWSAARFCLAKELHVRLQLSIGGTNSLESMTEIKLNQDRARLSFDFCQIKFRFGCFVTLSPFIATRPEVLHIFYLRVPEFLHPWALYTLLISDMLPYFLVERPAYSGSSDTLDLDTCPDCSQWVLESYQLSVAWILILTLFVHMNFGFVWVQWQISLVVGLCLWSRAMFLTTCSRISFEWWHSCYETVPVCQQTSIYSTDDLIRTSNAP